MVEDAVNPWVNDVDRHALLVDEVARRRAVLRRRLLPDAVRVRVVAGLRPSEPLGAAHLRRDGAKLRRPVRLPPVGDATVLADEVLARLQDADRSAAALRRDDAARVYDVLARLQSLNRRLVAFRNL